MYAFHTTSSIVSQLWRSAEPDWDSRLTAQTQLAGKMPRLTLGTSGRRIEPGGRAGPEIDAHTTRLWDRSATSTTARAVHALGDTTAKPICEGGLAHYFVSEAHRRAALEEQSRAAAAPSGFHALASLPASHQGRGTLEEPCAVCLEGNTDMDDDIIMLMCNHKFHKRCIVGWLDRKSVCPCCRARVMGMKPYRYPARTSLRSAFLRARLDYIVDWREVSCDPAMRLKDSLRPRRVRLVPAAKLCSEGVFSFG